MQRARYTNAVPTCLIGVIFFLVLGAAGLCQAASGVAGDSAGALAAAQRQFTFGNYSAAISTLQSAATQNPASAEVHYWLGRNYYELRDYDNAVAQGEKSVELDPKNSLYHDWLGRSYGGKADRERSFSLAKKTKKEFEAAVQLDPSNVAARRDLEEYDLQAPWIVGGNKDEARGQVDAIALLDPIQGHLARAVQYREAKKPELADNEYREVLKAKTNHIEVYFEVATYYARQNKAPDLEMAIQAAAQVSANDSRLAYFRGVSRVISGTEQQRAEEYLKAFLASTPERSDWPAHASAREWLGRLYEAEGKRTEAAEQYRAALQLEPDRKEARARLEQLEKK
ncbi:MAG: tetratricopeptide repeat protein [Candidatus Acidiferrales bacterium]